MLRYASVFRLVPLCFLVLSLLSASAFGLGLGEIKLKSHLNQPLVAEIELLQVRELALSEILPALASRKDFDAAGVERTFLLGMMRFEVKLGVNGRNIILVTTPKPVNEPFLNFLVEVIWPSGRLLREYTLLLDPPVYGNGESQVIAPAQKPSTSKNKQAAIVRSSSETANLASAPNKISASSSSKKNAETSRGSSAGATPANLNKEPTRSGNARPESAPRNPAMDNQRKSNQSNDESSNFTNLDESGQYRVKNGDNLLGIATKVRADSSTNISQVMMALQKDNPNAFIDSNVNLLKKGAVLRLPSASALANMDKRTAIQEVERQTKLWKARISARGQNNNPLTGRILNATGEDVTPDASVKSDQDGGHVSIVSSETGAKSKSGSGGSATKGTDNSLLSEEIDKAKIHNADLEERVASLSQQVEISKNLIELKDQQFAELKARLAEIDAENARLKQQLGMPASADTSAAGVDPVSSQVPVTDTIEPTTLPTTAPDAQIENASPVPDVEAPIAVAAESGVDAVLPVDGDGQPIASTAPNDYNFTDGQPTAEPMVQPTIEPAIEPAIEPTSNSMLNDFLHKPFLWMIVGGGLIVVLAAFLLWRRSKQEQFEDELDDDEDTQDEQNTTLADLDPMSAGDVTVAIGNDLGILSNSNDDKTVVSHPTTSNKSKDAIASNTKKTQLTPSNSMKTQVLNNASSELQGLSEVFGSTDAAEEAADILGEADIYIAYGRFDQAEDVLIKAINRDKTHPEYYLKLIEVYAEKNDVDGFNRTEKSLISQGFSANFSNRIAELRSTLINVVPGGTQKETLDTLPELVPNQASKLESVSDLDFDLSDEEDLFIQENVSDENAEGMLTLDDLESNILESVTSPEQADVSSTALLDFDTDEQDTINFTLDDPNQPNELDLLDEHDHNDDIISPKLQHEGLTENKFFTNISDVNEQLDVDMESLAADLDVDVTETDSVRTSFDLTSISENAADEVTGDEDEVATKLDLARAYMDMGDRDGAKDILDEVVRDGSKKQQQEAQSLLKKIS